MTPQDYRPRIHPIGCPCEDCRDERYLMRVAEGRPAITPGVIALGFAIVALLAFVAGRL